MVQKISRTWKTLFYSGFLLLLAGAALLLLALAESSSSNPVVLNRFSVPLASAILVMALICLAALYSLIFRTGSTLSLSNRIV